MQSNAQLQESSVIQRDVSSTAKLFNFDRPVFVSESVWKDCVELTGADGNMTDELTVLQRLRHVLFMASSALHDQATDLECEFSVHRVPNDGHNGYPEPTRLKVVTCPGLDNESRVTIKHQCE